MLVSASVCVFFFLKVRGPPRSTLDRSSAASDVYKRQVVASRQVESARAHDLIGPEDIGH